MFQENQHLRPGTALSGGRYSITRFIGAGGFGCTYEAEFVPMRSRVAIKEFFVSSVCNREASGVVTLGASSQASLVSKLEEKFRREAQRLFKLKHPGIVSVTDMIEENGTSYYVMDYIDGRSLQSVIDREGPLPEARALKYIGQVMDALEYVHGQNMLHLDIKPDNIMIDANDNAILIDFGVSKQYDEVDGHNTSTIMGQTPGFAPPEQTGNRIRQFVPAADIYALGATLYCALTGCVPPCCADIISGEAELEPLPAGTSASTRHAIDAMMQANVKFRPQSIAAVRTMLRSSSETQLAPVAFSNETELALASSNETVVASQTAGAYSNETVFDQTPIADPANGHEWVDMGTSVKWANMNVGALSEKDYGDYFAWGEASQKDDFRNDNSLTYCKDVSAIAGDNRYDPVAACWGGGWRMPTKEEFQELIDNCEWVWCDSYYEVRSKKTGNVICIPAAGWRQGKSLNFEGERGYYWSSVPNGGRYAWGLGFNSEDEYIGDRYRFYGHSVRPVLD